jgi:hypothetical protein
VATEVKEQLNRILKSMGLNEYQWLQLMIEVTIRMMDDRHNLSAAMAKMIQMFSMVPGFKDAASLVDANAEGKIDAAIKHRQCPNCHAEVSEGQKFCSECGSALC